MNTIILPEPEQKTRKNGRRQKSIYDRLYQLAGWADQAPAAGLRANPETLVPLGIALYEIALETFRRMS